MQAVIEAVTAADDANDWKGVLQHQGRMEEMLDGQPDILKEIMLRTFIKAQEAAMFSTALTGYALSAVKLEEILIPLPKPRNPKPHTLDHKP